MAEFFDALTEEHAAFVAEQPMFFVATAPPEGRINLSPKGMDSLRVVDERTVAYVDVTGSGNETAAHVAADGRLTLMLCSFGRRPLILRIYGRGRVLAIDDALAAFPGADLPTTLPGARQVLVCDVESVQTSCGYAVPVMELVEERQTLKKWAAAKDDEELAAYRARKNATSIDGLAVPDTLVTA